MKKQFLELIVSGHMLNNKSAKISSIESSETFCIVELSNGAEKQGHKTFKTVEEARGFAEQWIN